MSKRVRVSVGFALLGILTLSISGSARAEHGYGPTGPVPGESFNGSGALFGPDGCNTLNNSGIAGYPQTAYGTNGGYGGSTDPGAAIPQPSRVQPAAPPSNATPTPANTPAPVKDVQPEPQKKASDDDASKRPKAADDKPKAPTDKEAASKDKDLIAAGAAAMGKCVSCHESDGGPKGTPSSRPASMPPKGSGMTAEEIRAVDAYLASKG